MTNRPKMDDWGRVKADLLSAHELLQLSDELSGDGSGFINQRHLILEAWKNDKLFGLRVEETGSMYDRHARSDPIFVPFSWYLLPCFCVVDHQTAKIFWVHSRARRLGFGRKLVEELGIKTASIPLPDSRAFWSACGVKGDWTALHS